MDGVDLLGQRARDAGPRRLRAGQGHVVMAVVGTEDLQHVVAPRVGAGDPDGRHGRLRAGVGVAPERQPEAPAQLLGHRHEVLQLAKLHD